MAKPRKSQTAEIKVQPGKFKIALSILLADGEVCSANSELDMRCLAIRNEEFVKQFLTPAWELLKDHLAFSS